MDKKENKNSDYLYKVERVCGNGSFGIVFQAKTYSSSLDKHNMPVIAFVSNLSKVPFNKTILEVGCGNGEGTKYLTLQAPSHCVIYSLDFSEPMLELANDTFKNFTNFNSNKDNSYEKIAKESIKQKLTVKMI